MKWTMGGSYGVCDSDELGLRLVLEIGICEGPSLGILLEYTLGTWLGIH